VNIEAWSAIETLSQVLFGCFLVSLHCWMAAQLIFTSNNGGSVGGWGKNRTRALILSGPYLILKTVVKPTLDYQESRLR